MNSMQHSSLTKSAPYGQACTNCSKAKTRCVPRATGRCERCNRLDKDCTPSQVVRRRVSRKTTSASRKAQLEEKLDSLVSLLQYHNAQQPQTNVPVNSVSPLRVDVEAKPTSESAWGSLQTPEVRDGFSLQSKAPQGTVDDTPAFPNPCTTLTPAATLHTNSTPESLGYGVGGEEISPLQAEEMLHRFRTIYIKNMPLIYIPAETTAAQFQQDHPFLWLVIRTICTKSAPDQQVLAARIRETLSRKIMCEYERTTDLLLGLVAYLSWSIHFSRGKPFMCSLMHIAISMVMDLRLDRREQEDASWGPPHLNCFKPHAFSKNQPVCSTFKPVTREDRRALLSCFLCYSLVSFFMRFIPIRWMPYLDEALTTLSDEPETADDLVLVALVRIAIVAESASRVSRKPEDPDSTLPTMLHIRALKASLDHVKRGISPETLSNPIVALQMYSVEASIFEIATHHQPSSVYPTLDTQRIEYLHSCLQATKAVFDTFFTLNVADYHGLPFSTMIHFAHAAQILYRLSLLEDPGWDRVLVRETADVLAYLELGANNFEQAHAAGAYSANGMEESLLTRGAQSLRTTIPLWEESMKQAGAVPAEGARAELGADGVLSDPMLMDFTDDTWLTSLFSSWEY